MSRLRILCIGDVVGNSGRAMFQKHAAAIKRNHNIDMIVVNGENCATNGRGISSKHVKFFKHCGADVITSGNHIWANKEIYSYLSQHSDLIRPANFPSGCPGVGVTTVVIKDHVVAVVNLQARTNMKQMVDCPFKAADSLLTYLSYKTKTIIVDFHAETTSEKMGMGHYLDGRVSAVVGTHTHVQTADERILPYGTAFITDLGLVGALNGMLGMKKDPIIENFITQMPVKFAVETKAPFVLCGVWIDVDTQTGKALDIKRVRVIDEELLVDDKEEDK